jgi:Ni,Fe-hydrogenase I small subunit
MECGACSGESMAILGAEGRGKSGDTLPDFLERAEYVLATGSCASFGGIPAAPPNPSESNGLQYTNAERGGLLAAE